LPYCEPPEEPPDEPPEEPPPLDSPRCASGLDFERESLPTWSGLLFEATFFFCFDLSLLLCAVVEEERSELEPLIELPEADLLELADVLAPVCEPLLVPVEPEP